MMYDVATSTMTYMRMAAPDIVYATLVPAVRDGLADAAQLITAASRALQRSIQ